MSLMRCEQCQRVVDTDYAPGEFLAGRWLCEFCAADHLDALEKAEEELKMQMMTEQRASK